MPDTPTPPPPWWSAFIDDPHPDAALHAATCDNQDAQSPPASTPASDTSGRSRV